MLKYREFIPCNCTPSLRSRNMFKEDCPFHNVELHDQEQRFQDWLGELD